MMLRIGMDDAEMTTFIEETFCVQCPYTAQQLFDAAQLAPSWQSAIRRPSA